MKRFSTTYLTIAAVLLFALAGCNNPLTPPEQGTGNVLISIGGGAPRTLSPTDTALNGLSYQLTFSGSGSAGHATETVTFGQVKAVNLVPGNWTITAQAKSGGSVKAEGSWNGEVSASETRTVSITLAPKSGGGNGTFEYTVSFPDLGAEGSKSLALYAVTESGGETAAPGTPVTDFTSGSSRTLSLPAGLYRLNLSLTNSTGKTAAKTAAVHIYPGLTTTGVFSFDMKDYLEVSIEELADHIAGLSWNTAANPHTVKLDRVNITENGVMGRINDAVTNRYVIVDLSDCYAADNTISGSGSDDPGPNDMNVIKSNQYILGVILPDSLTSIGEWAFSDCTSLGSVTIPGSVTSIGYAAFYGCTSLGSVTIPGSVTSI
ncbi:MAG: leucine-rich repeat domain-containing protein, partial [Treponema sp.]|nr:leucine-rich repeat domain-containing protein [Treponema sp.]